MSVAPTNVPDMASRSRDSYKAHFSKRFVATEYPDPPFGAVPVKTVAVVIATAIKSQLQSLRTISHSLFGSHKTVDEDEKLREGLLDRRCVKPGKGAS